MAAPRSIGDGGMDFDRYERLVFERKPHGVLLITINRLDKLNAADATMSREFVEVWRDVDEDTETRVAVITGAGRAFSAGGEIDKGLSGSGDLAAITHLELLQYRRVEVRIA
jgi:enoyl-CoA hydratase